MTQISSGPGHLFFEAKQYMTRPLFSQCLPLDCVFSERILFSFSFFVVISVRNKPIVQSTLCVCVFHFDSKGFSTAGVITGGLVCLTN